ncbi:MAG: DUF885 domain-containing protein [Gammaproteobacteria bacterium]|nr:DUF885 domain-containing protein [Gammaproteobacteria bacterium]
MKKQLLTLGAGLALGIASSAPAYAAQDWVQQSNEYTQIRLKADAEFNPEMAASVGLDGYDDQVFDMALDVDRRRRASLEAMIQRLEKAQAEEDSAKVRQDIQILIDDARATLERMALEQEYLFTYFNLPQAIFGSIHSLLQPHIDSERYPAAITRMRKYTGMADGYTSVFTLFRQHVEKDLAENPDAIGPYIKELEKDIANSSSFIAGLRDLFTKAELEGWEPAVERFEEQLEAHNQWLEEFVKPKARKDFRMPAELYANSLKNWGVTDWSPEELIERATASFFQIRLEMQALAKEIAAERGFESDDYRDVIRELKKAQFDGEEIMPAYEDILEQLEETIEEHEIVSLPEREAIIRLASEAESAQQPAPHMQPPRLIGNTGEQGQFVLPLNNPNAESDAKMDDFTHEAAAWTLTAHEARPGHEMQFAAMVEYGVSQARMLYAFNSANIEGWALYAEAVMYPYLPKEGQLFSLQMRLQRAVRAFIDPMLNLGRISREEAKAFIMNEVVLSEPMATQEVDRYTFRLPGQATAYFYGLAKLTGLRTRAEIVLGDRFKEKAFHDFILKQGLLPPDLMEKAVMEDFVPSQR